ncbi:HlyD family efflux transporter periplasmic adaptor subunit [Hyphomicrobium sp. D-2]|uniref:HlyD family secretion protein n=1 Tax=Hyphomicrobium sp. D-2 TaxID=3041621 RepID=UPI0024565465|nr:HlyD family efflux transporter periplasmic adaptor subunit [Hyphomicrobium sp. D-2]MDH4982435.1 efflux RND transporter periplasmic adaptor subunit [Hyphomicrobium sp. D-2]
MGNKVNSTVVTLAIAGALAVAVGFYVNRVSWAPVGEHVASSGTETGSNKKAAVTAAAMRPTWAASATGRVEPKSGEVRVTATTPGRIVTIPVALNDSVKSGDVLLRLDDEDAMTKVTAATAEEQVRVRERDEEEAVGLQLERRKAEDAVAEAKRAVFAAQQELDAAYIEARTKNGAETAVDNARTKLADTEKKLDDELTKMSTVLNKGGMPLPTRLESALTISRTDVDAAELGVEHTRIRAPFDGTVLNVIAKEGEVAAPSPENTLVVFGDLTSMKVRAEVEERDAAKIRKGQRVVVRADAYPNQDFEGKVDSIAQSLSPPNIVSRGPRRPNDVEVLEVLVDLDGNPPLLTGMRVDVFFKHDATASTN